MIIGKFKMDARKRFNIPSHLLKARGLEDCDFVELHIDNECGYDEFRIKLIKADLLKSEPDE